MQTGWTLAVQLTCKAWLALAQEASCLAVAEGAGEVGLCPVVGWVGALQAQAPVVAGLCHTLIHILLTVLPSVPCSETHSQHHAQLTAAQLQVLGLTQRRE